MVRRVGEATFLNEEQDAGYPAALMLLMAYTATGKSVSEAKRLAHLALEDAAITLSLGLESGDGTTGR